MKFALAFLSLCHTYLIFTQLRSFLSFTMLVSTVYPILLILYVLAIPAKCLCSNFIHDTS